MLCQKENRTCQRAGGGFETGSEKNCHLTDQLVISHETFFIITRHDQIVITGDSFFMKGWQDELALLLMLRTVQPGETEANTALGGVFRAVNELTSSAKFRGIAQNLPIKFRSDCKHVQLGGFAKRN